MPVNDPVHNTDIQQQSLLLEAEDETRALPTGLLSSPQHDPQPPTMLSLFAIQIAAAPPTPVLPVPPPSEQPKTSPWRSDCLAKKGKAQLEAAPRKTSAKLLPVERAQGVLMSKLGIPDEPGTSKEGRST